MREIRTSGATRGGGVTLVTSPLLYWLPLLVAAAPRCASVAAVDRPWLFLAVTDRHRRISLPLPVYLKNERFLRLTSR